MEKVIRMSEAQQREYQTVTLGALLHDVGKYLQRAKGDTWGKGKHPQISANFIEDWKEQFGQCTDEDLLKTLAQRHHESSHFQDTLNVNSIKDDHVRALARLVSRADNMSSFERAEKSRESQYYRTTALATNFHHIQLIKDKQCTPHYLNISSLENVSKGLPVLPTNSAKNDLNTVTEVIFTFVECFNRYKDRMDWSDISTVYTNVYSLFQRYLAFLPADTQTDPPDISLFDHNRMCSAIAACLYQYHLANNTLNEKDIMKHEFERCILLGGDISGIQSYLYGVSTIGAGGVAKRLRARSFFLQMLSDVASLKIIDYFSLPYANIIMSSGGNFTVLLPNLEEIGDHIDHLQAECDNWLLDNYHGALTLNLAWIPVSDYNFGMGKKDMGFGYVMDRLRQELKVKKQNPLKQVLYDKKEWDTQRFERQPFPEGVGDCLVCGRFPATEKSQPDGEKDICHQCAQDVTLGRLLTKRNYIVFYNSDNDSGNQCFDWTFHLASTKQDIKGQPKLVTRINDPDLVDICEYPAVFRYMANYVASEPSGEIWTFEEIAAQRRIKDGETSEGHLAVIKLDVDYLGQVFTEGLSRDVPPRFDSPSRLATLSRHLDHFFTGWVHWLLKNEFPHSYTVYSGGDDLFLVAPQQKALTLVRHLREGFVKLTQNGEITVSAGIAVVKPRLPIAHTAVFAEESLKKAKEKRNCICILNHIVQWEDLSLNESTIAFFHEEEPNSAFLYQLIRFAEMWQAWKTTRDPVHLKFIPLLAWAIKRNLDKKQKMFRWASRLLQFNVNDPECDEAKIMDHLGLIAKWEILHRRTK